MKKERKKMKKQKNKITFNIDYKVTHQDSLNKFYSGMHWTERTERANYWHGLTKASLTKAKVDRVFFDQPIHITFYFNSNLDADNHGALIKMIIDGMCNYVIKDDTKKYVRSYGFRFHDDPGIKVAVEVIDD